MATIPKEDPDNKCSEISFRKQVLLMIKQNNNSAVQEILKNYNFRHAAEDQGATLLHCSASYGNLEITQYLLDRGFDINAQDVMGRTPLMKAVMGRHEEFVKSLLVAGADIHVFNNEGNCVLYESFTRQPDAYKIQDFLLEALRGKYSHSEEIATRLMDARCPIFLAILLEDSRIIEFMIKKGYPVNSAHPTDKYTALHKSFEACDLENIKLLIKHGANIRAQNSKGFAPLPGLYINSRKIKRNDHQTVEILKFLSHEGILSQLCNPSDAVQLGFILQCGNCEEVRVILQSAIDFKIKLEFSKMTLLHYLALNLNPGVADVLKLYIKKFDVNAVDSKMICPLSTASFQGNVDFMKLLLNEGTKADGYTKHVDSIPLHLIYCGMMPNREHQYDQCAELLLQYNADLQLIGVDNGGKELTIIDTALDARTNNFYRMKLATARLAILERQGKPIIDRIRSQIKSERYFKKYFRRCQKILKKKMIRSITVSKLFTVSDKKIVHYLRDEKLVQKLVRISHKTNSYVRAFKSLGKRIEKILYKMRLQNTAAKSICKIFDGRVDKNNLIVEKIINYLNDETLLLLCEV